MIHNNIRDSGGLSLNERGIFAGINGMAVGVSDGLLSPKLVCEEYGTEVANPRISCLLVIGNRDNVSVRKEPLIVEVTLTASCIPVFRGSRHDDEIGCRDSEIPQRDPNAPVWRFYYAEPSHS